jgi:hypothetical protein
MKRHNTRWSGGVLRALALAAGVSSLLATGAVRAEEAAKDPRPRPAAPGRTEILTDGTYRFNGRWRNWNPSGPVTPGLPGTPYLPQGVVETYPFTPFQQPDILRNYLQMRATSPNPNQFMGGQFNPQYQRVGPRNPPYGYPYYGGYGDVAPPGYGYGGLFYGGYAFTPAGGLSVYPSIYSSYGSWYPQYLPQNRVVVQREIIYVRPESGAEPPAARTEPPARPGSEPASGDYYLRRPRVETLNDAIEDIRRAWLNGDYSRFRSRVKEDARVRIYLKGKYQYSVAGEDFGQMTRDAMTRIDTTGFELDRVTPSGANRAFASGRHIYVDPDKQKREVYVSYGLARENGRWLITEAGSSSAAVEKHVE